jgi:uncharacterized protein YciI
MRLWVVISHAGPNRNLDLGVREQEFWTDHEIFIDELIDEGVIRMGGPLPGVHGGLIVIDAESEDEVRRRIASDPWYREGILKLESIYEWDLYFTRIAAT